jgi:ribosomal protein S18 acetylase RimI-like enzyme
MSGGRYNLLDRLTSLMSKLVFFDKIYQSSGSVRHRKFIADELKIRGAVKKDANKAVELIHIAITDIAEQLTGQTKKENIQKTLSQFFRGDNNRLSYQNIIVADILGKIAGIIITYPGEKATRLDEPILKRLRKKRRNEEIHFDKEANENDFYIDTLCVNDLFRGYGIGTMLLKDAEKMAIEKGYSRVSLNVAHDNQMAKKLYERVGYSKEKVIQINKHPYDYMVKTLKEGG